MSDRTPPPLDHPETFLGRWSRLKRGEETEPLAPAAGTDEAPPPADTAQRLLTDEDMPPLEDLGEDSDFSAFLSQGVSDALRRKALEKLWGLPMCAALDGLNDYDDDFSTCEPLGDTITYQMRQWAERQARQAPAGDEPACGAPQAAGPGAPQQAEDGESPTADETAAADPTAEA